MNSVGKTATVTIGGFPWKIDFILQGIFWNILFLLIWVLASIPDCHIENERWIWVIQLPLDVQQFPFHASLWCLSGSEETILVFVASELIESEITRISCFAWKSQNLKGALKGRVAFKHNML